MVTRNPKKIKNKGEPKLDAFIRPEKVRHYATYAQAACYYSLPYYTLVMVAKQAKANLMVRRNVVVDLDILNTYMETELRRSKED